MDSWPLGEFPFGLGLRGRYADSNHSADLEDENVKKNYMDAYGVLLSFFHEHM
jgi:hypothetical protein